MKKTPLPTAGKALDIQMAEQVLGYEPIGPRTSRHWCDAGERITIADAHGKLNPFEPGRVYGSAFRVIEALRALDFDVQIDAFTAEGWRVTIPSIICREAESLPLAICAAALDAIKIHRLSAARRGAGD